MDYVVLNYGANIRAARKAAGLTQKKLADRLGISSVNISQLENNQRTPNIATLQRMADALGIHILKLTGITDETDKYEVEYEVKNKDGTPIPPDEMEEIEKVLSSGIEGIYNSFSNEERKEFWRWLIGNGGITGLQLESSRTKIEAALDQMNEEGQIRVAEYAEAILPRYRLNSVPQPPTTPSETDNSPNGSDGK